MNNREKSPAPPPRRGLKGLPGVMQTRYLKIAATQQISDRINSTRLHWRPVVPIGDLMFFRS